MGIGPALFSLHYHVAKLRGEAGDPHFATWAKNAKRMAGRELRRPPNDRILQRIWPLDTAVRSLTQLEAETKRVDEEARATPEDEDLRLRAKQLNLHRRLAHAKLLEGHLVSRRAGEKTQAQAQISAFAEQVFGKEALDEAYRIHKEGPEKDEAESSVSLLQPDLTFKWIHRGIDGCGKSSIIAEGARDGITNEIDEYSKLTDPCLWFRNIPETFKVSYRTETPTLPRVSDTPAQSKRLHLDGDAWEGYLFEVAALELFPGEDLTEFRNILNVKYYGDIKKSLTGDLRIEYSLYESLTSEVFGIQDQGGIDVDSGTGRVTLRDGRLTIRSEKGIRFSDATPFSDELNVVALPWLIWWMSAVIIGGLTA